MYLQDTACISAESDLFQNDIPNHGYKVGMKLECADLMDPRLVCVGTVAKIVGRLLKIHFDGWEDEYDQWLDCESPDMYPVGWCYLVGHKLEGPRVLPPIKQMQNVKVISKSAPKKKRKRKTKLTDKNSPTTTRNLNGQKFVQRRVHNNTNNPRNIFKSHESHDSPLNTSNSIDGDDDGEFIYDDDDDDDADDDHDNNNIHIVNNDNDIDYEYYGESSHSALEHTTTTGSTTTAAIINNSTVTTTHSPESKMDKHKNVFIAQQVPSPSSSSSSSFSSIITTTSTIQQGVNTNVTANSNQTLPPTERRVTSYIVSFFFMSRKEYAFNNYFDVQTYQQFLNLNKNK